MTYRQFWPVYLSLHADPVNRALHVAGTLAALGLLAVAVALGNGWLAGAAPVVGYGSAWAGHALVERNRPATFRHPFLSLVGDLHMSGLFLTGRLGRELDRRR
ncbi:MAG: DUF962 domain-containing protein [Magnetospirillum sp.]|nr:DUF962 domain-containing protein [Magnetospirillum sp.]